LFHLVAFRVPTLFLEVQPFLDAGPSENMVAASSAFLKAEPEQETPEILEVNRRIRLASQDLTEKLLPAAHSFILSQGRPFDLADAGAGRPNGSGRIKLWLMRSGKPDSAPAQPRCAPRKQKNGQ
jgi:hypothetical protein